MQIKKLLMAVLVVMLAPLCFAACGEDFDPNTYVSVGWIEVGEDSRQISMAVESQSTFKINYSVVPSNATDLRVTFTSGDKNVVEVDEDGVITAKGVGETLVTVRSVANETAYATVRVVVSARRQKLSAPTNVIYDATSGKVAWTPVSVANSSYVPSYKVKMLIDGVEKIETVSTASYDGVQKGKVYELSVCAVGNSAMYDTSEYSTAISFAQLDAPNDVEIVTSTKERSFERVYQIRFKLSNLTDSIEDYEVDIKNLTSGALSKYDQDLWNLALNPAMVTYNDGYCYVTIPEELSRATFGVRFKVKADETANYYASSYSTAIQFSRLTAPDNLSMSQNANSQILTWSSVRYATGYKLLFDYELLSGSTLSVTHIVSADSENPTSFDIAQLEGKPAENEYSDFYAYIYAIGSDDVVAGVRYLDSARSVAPATKQLAMVNWVMFEKDTAKSTYHITWSAVDHAKTYVVYVSPTTEGESSDEITEYDRRVYVGSGLRTDSDGNVLDGLGCDIGFTQTIVLNGSTVPVWTVGYNNIKIIAYPGDAPTEGTSSENVAGYIESKTYVHNESFIKLATPTNFIVSEGRLIWNSVDYVGTYQVNFNNGKTPAKVTPRGVAVEEYSPSEPKTGESGSLDSGDMPVAGQAYSVTLRATNEGIAYIDSDDTPAITAIRYAASSEIKVVDGNLTWSRVDIAGNPISAEWFEVQIKRDGVVIDTFQTNLSVSITERLDLIEGENREFEFSVRAINTSTAGTYPYINGWWSESKSVNTYQLPTPQNVRIENGEIKWDAFSDDKIAAGHSGIRFVLMVGSQKYGVSGNPILTINSTSAIIPGLSANSTIYNIKMQTVIDSDSAGSYGITVGPDTYIINSGYTETFRVSQLSLATNVTVRDTTLYWSASNIDLNRYRVELYKVNVDATGTVRSRAEEPSMVAVVEPADRVNPSWNFGLDFGITTTSVDQGGTVVEITDFIFGSGAYQFVVFAVGSESFSAQNDKSTYGYLTSYESSYVEIYKLDVPTLDVDNGVVRWTNVSSNLGGVATAVRNYLLSVSCDAGTQEITVSDFTSSALDALPSTFYNKQLSIRIKAMSSWSRVFDSEMSAIFVRPSTSSEYSNEIHIVQKQPKILIDTETSTNYISIDGRTVSWLDANTDNRSYSLQLYKKDAVNGTNLFALGSTSETRFEIADVTGGNYFLKVLRKGYVSEQIGQDYTLSYRRLDSAYSDNIYIYRFYKPINLDLTRTNDGNPILKWSTGTATDNDMLRFKIEITYVADGGEAEISSYYVPYNIKELDLKNGVVYDEEGNETTIRDYGAGMLSITIQAVSALNPDGTRLSKYINSAGNLVHLMDSQISMACIAYIYKAPDVTFEEGLITLNKSTSNVLDKGTQLIVTPLIYDESTETYSLDEAGKVQIDIKAKVNTYDMSDLTAGVKYRLELRALGDTKYNFTSTWEDCGYIIEKLNPLNPNSVAGTIENKANFNGWYLQDGEIFWSAIEGASTYIAQVVKGDVVRNAFEMGADATTNTYSSSITSLDVGEYDLQFIVKGGKTDKTATINTIDFEYTLGYVTSAVSTAQKVTKLYAPNNYNIAGRSSAYSRVVDGEFDWGIRDENDAWIDADGVTKYLVELNDTPYTFDLDGVARYFDAKSLIDLKGEYLVRLYSIGNTWMGINDAGTPCLSSDAYGQFTLIYAGEDYNLHVENGTLAWNATSNSAGAGYELQYELTGDTSNVRSTRVTTNAYSFDGINEAGCEFDAIRVRYSGDTSTIQGAFSGHVNTSWSLDIRNIVKLPDINYDTVRKNYMYVNEWGQLAWNYGDYYNAEPYSSLDLSMHLWLDIRYQGVSVGGNSQGVDIRKANASVYDVVAIDITQEEINNALASAGIDASLATGGILKYNFFGYVAGSVSAIDGEKAFLNSDTYEHAAYKLNDPTSFAPDTINGPSLRLNWNISNCGVSGFDPDLLNGAGGTVNVAGNQILFAYRMNGSTSLQYKIVDSVDLISQIPLWSVGYFDEIRLIVLNSAGQAFGSDPLVISNLSFEHFAGGSGTGVDPFIIKDHDNVSALYQLELVYWLPELYFKLGQNVALADLVEVQANNSNATMNFPVPVMLNGSSVNDIYKQMKFTGGFDGAGYSITNFQTAGAQSFGWWNSIESVVPVNLDSVGENFYYRGGVIKNLTIEAYSINVSSLISNSYSGLFAKENYGWIVDSNVTGAEKSDADGFKLEVVTGAINQADVYIGGLVGLVGQRSETLNGVTTYYGDGRIEGCNNMLNIKVYSAENKNLRSIVGGIAGYNYLGIIIDCSNGQTSMPNFNSAQISGFDAGGIVGRVSGIEITAESGEKSYRYARISGCVNYGTITSVSLVSESVESCVSGGIAANVQIGFVTYCINYGLVTSSGYYPIMGGVVGYTFGGGFVLSCVNMGIVRGNIYYESNGVVNIEYRTEPTMGSLIGSAYNDSRLCYSYHVANKVEIVDNSVSGDNTVCTSPAFGYSAIEPDGVETVNDFALLDGDDVATFLASVNKSTIVINSESVTYIYPSTSGLVAQFAMLVGGSPSLEWVVPETE